MPLERELGGYEIVGRLAVGGMAEVYQARALPGTQRSEGEPDEVVLKRLLPSYRNDGSYVKHFIGPQEGMPLIVRILLPVLIFPIEIFSHLARILSLTVRLFANMFAGEMVTLVFFSLVPLGLPILFEGLHIGVSFIQTYIFVLLAAVYFGEAVAHEH